MLLPSQWQTLRQWQRLRSRQQLDIAFPPGYWSSLQKAKCFSSTLFLNRSWHNTLVPLPKPCFYKLNFKRFKFKKSRHTCLWAFSDHSFFPHRFSSFRKCVFSSKSLSGYALLLAQKEKVNAVSAKIRSRSQEDRIGCNAEARLRRWKCMKI